MKPEKCGARHTGGHRRLQAALKCLEHIGSYLCFRKITLASSWTTDERRKKRPEIRWSAGAGLRQWGMDQRASREYWWVGDSLDTEHVVGRSHGLAWCAHMEGLFMTGKWEGQTTSSSPARLNRKSQKNLQQAVWYKEQERSRNWRQDIVKSSAVRW